MVKSKQNFAFIDSQNLNMATQSMGWNLDWIKFRDYLHDEFNVGVAYLFIGFMPENQDLYASLQKAGYILIFKPVHATKEGVKGNIDAELVLQAMVEIDNYEQAVIVSGDADFYCLVSYLNQHNKLSDLIVPNQRHFNSVLADAAKERIQYLNNMRRRLEYRRYTKRAKSPAPATPTKPTSPEQSLLNTIENIPTQDQETRQ